MPDCGFVWPPASWWLALVRHRVFTVVPVHILPGADSPARPEVLSCLPKKGPKEGHPDFAREPCSGRAGPAALNSLRLRLRSDIQRFSRPITPSTRGSIRGAKVKTAAIQTPRHHNEHCRPKAPRRPLRGRGTQRPQAERAEDVRKPSHHPLQQRRDSCCFDLPPRCRRAEWRGFSRDQRRWMSERSRRRSEFSAAREKPRSEGNPGPLRGPGSRQSGVFLGYFFARAKKYLGARWRVSAWQAARRRHVNTRG